MKQIIYTIGFIALAPFFAFGIAGISCLLIIKADGKTFYEIISSPELIGRFIGAAVIFGTLIYLFARFIVIPFFNYLSDNDNG